MTLRCTRKLLDRVGVSAKAETTPPTTVPGGWYANLIYTKPQQLGVVAQKCAMLSSPSGGRLGGDLMREPFDNQNLRTEYAKSTHRNR